MGPPRLLLSFQRSIIKRSAASLLLLAELGFEFASSSFAARRGTRFLASARRFATFQQHLHKPKADVGQISGLVAVAFAVQNQLAVAVDAVGMPRKEPGSPGGIERGAPAR